MNTPAVQETSQDLVGTNQDRGVYRAPNAELVAPQQMERTNINVLENLRAQAESWEAAEYIAGKLVNTAAAGPFKGKSQDLAAAILKGASLGIPAESIGSSIYVAHGSPSLYAKAALAIAKSYGYEFIKLEYTPQVVRVEATAPNGMSYPVTYTFERADREGLVKQNKIQYTTRPEKMLFWKCIGELADQFFPHLLNGMEIKEDVEQSADTIKATAKRMDQNDETAAQLRSKLMEQNNTNKELPKEPTQEVNNSELIEQIKNMILNATTMEQLHQVPKPENLKPEEDTTLEELWNTRATEITQ